MFQDIFKKMKITYVTKDKIYYKPLYFIYIYILHYY